MSDHMLSSSTHCRTYRTSNKLEIISVLKNNPLKISAPNGVLIGSRAARHFLPNFRDIPEDTNADWDVICSSDFLLQWLNKKENATSTINMIIPASNDNKHLDLYVDCILKDGSKYDFSIPKSVTSYTAYILQNSKEWMRNDYQWRYSLKEKGLIIPASIKLLIILKKYMLYYPHQWEKTAKDYRELLAIADTLTEDDKILCDLFIEYNEEIFGKRPSDADEFTANSTDNQKCIIIKRDEFSELKDDQQISSVYQAAMSLSSNDDILIGLEYICTQGPPWLADYTIKHWISIQQEKFKQKFQPVPPCIQFEIENYRLFSEIPEIATKLILNFINDPVDFRLMQLVCKRWYTILREEIFWRDLYISRYGPYTKQIDNIKSWKMLYLVRLQGISENDNNTLEELVDTTIKLRQYTTNDILKLWEDLTHQNQSIESVLFSKINYILSNSFYYQMEKTPETYSVRLIINGLEHEYSRSKVYLKVRFGEYGGSRFGDHMEALYIEYESDNNKHHSLSFFGPQLIGFYMGKWGYVRQRSTELGQSPSEISDQYPSGLLICLFIMMVHPEHQAQFIKYLKALEKCCLSSLSCLGY